jgi:rare lipoprotein A (peptidoglycan hydrolase)
MKRLSATTAALTAAAMTAAVTLPAAASTTGASNGGASATAPAAQPDQSAQAQTAQYKRAKATWYGPGLYGNQLACGGRLKPHTLGVAHKSLPCGTNVALKYRGRTVVVPVIDRGPYAHGVAYDLTEATARKLGMTQTVHLGAAPLDG